MTRNAWFYVLVFLFLLQVIFVYISLWSLLRMGLTSVFGTGDGPNCSSWAESKLENCREWKYFPNTTCNPSTKCVCRIEAVKTKTICLPLPKEDEEGNREGVWLIYASIFFLIMAVELPIGTMGVFTVFWCPNLGRTSLVVSVC